MNYKKIPKQCRQMKRLLFRFTMLTLLLVCSCDNNQQSVPIDSLMVGKWKLVEYAGGSVNALDTISFYDNGKMDYPFETGEFTYRLIKPDSLIIFIRDFGVQHFKIFKLSIDSLIRQIMRHRVFADSLD